VNLSQVDNTTRFTFFECNY